MKTTKNMALLAAVAAALSLGACNLTSGITKTPGSAATASSTTGNTGKGQKAGKGTPAKETEPKNAQTAVTEDALAGEWNIVAVGKTSITDREDMPYLNFDRGNVYGSNGCNILNGNYKLDAGRLSFSHVASTRRYCPDVPFEHDINVVVADGTSYPVRIERVGHESYLYLMGGNGNKLLTARRHNMGFLNGQWQVTSIDGKEIDDEECNIFFDIAEGKVHGNTGCNYFNGSVYINSDRSNALELSNMGVTRMACYKTEQQTAMLVAMEQTASAIQGSDGRVMLLDKNGKKLITLRRIDKTDITD